MELNVTNSKNFDFRYIDRVIERPALRTLLYSAIKGSFVGCDDIMDEAFEGLTFRQKQHFVRVLKKVWTTHIKRRARAEARKRRADAKLALVLEDLRREEELDREARAFTSEWSIVSTGASA